jgi:hydrogenase-4 component F
MISPILILILIALVFAGGGAAVFRFKTHKAIMLVPVVTSLVVSVLAGFWGLKLYQEGPFLFCFGQMIIDSLAIFHIILVNILFTASSAYMIDYFKKINTYDKKPMFYRKRYVALWLAFHAMLLLVLVSNNIGLIWIAIESTTLVSSFLILSEKDSLSVEAMWKYLLVCSIGIALAFIGTVLVIATAHALPSNDAVYTFSELQLNASKLDPSLMLFAFIFIVVGFGTKAGLAPMHTWLPDAHSQAPSPASALFSGVMLNCALFAIMRYLPIVDTAGGAGYAHSILLFFGFTSIIVAMVFMPIQRDLKRLLAYCSVEHIGIIALCIGLGGFGSVVALFHTLNHSLAKMLAFFSAGSIINHYGTREMKNITGVLKRMPIWGIAFLISMFVLIGIAPSSIFLSEFMLARTAFTNGNYITLAFFLFGALVIFIPMLKFTIDIAYGKADEAIKPYTQKVSLWNKIIIVGCFLEFIIFGLWLPEPLMHFLKSAASIIEHGIKL